MAFPVKPKSKTTNRAYSNQAVKGLKNSLPMPVRAASLAPPAPLPPAAPMAPAAPKAPMPPMAPKAPAGPKGPVDPRVAFLQILQQERSKRGLPPGGM